MSYDLHITRAGSQLRAAECPIPRAQWEAAFEGWQRAGEIEARFYWRDGQICVYTVEEHIGEIAAFAAANLGARLLGGDDEEYLPDGTAVFTDPACRPDLIPRAKPTSSGTR